MIRPSPQYNIQNESLFRAEVEKQDGENIKTNRAITSLIWIDETDGAPYRVTLVSGGFVFTAIPA